MEFDDFIAEIEAEAHAAGPEAVAELEAFRVYFSAARSRLPGRRQACLERLAASAAQAVPGRQMLVFDSDEEVSSEVAASMLGVSRPYLNELLDVEAIAYRRVGNQRRIRVVDLNAYRERREKRRRRDAPRRRAQTERILAMLGPIRRDRPRDPIEAEFLRRIGTPERLIGPDA